MAQTFLDSIYEGVQKAGKAIVDVLPAEIKGSVEKLYNDYESYRKSMTADQKPLGFTTWVSQLGDKAKEYGEEAIKKGEELYETYGPDAKNIVSKSVGTILGGLALGAIALLGLEMGIVGTLLMVAMGALIGAFADGEEGALGGLVKAIRGSHGPEPKTVTKMLDINGNEVENLVEANLVMKGHMETIQGKNTFIPERFAYADLDYAGLPKIPTDENGNIIYRDMEKAKVTFEADENNKLIITQKLKDAAGKSTLLGSAAGIPPAAEAPAAAGKPDFVALDADNNRVLPEKAQLLIQGHYAGDKFIVERAAMADAQGNFKLDDKALPLDTPVTGITLSVKNGAVDFASAETTENLKTLRNNLKEAATTYFGPGKIPTMDITSIKTQVKDALRHSTASMLKEDSHTVTLQLDIPLHMGKPGAPEMSERPVAIVVEGRKVDNDLVMQKVYLGKKSFNLKDSEWKLPNALKNGKMDAEALANVNTELKNGALDSIVDETFNSPEIKAKIEALNRLQRSLNGKDKDTPSFDHFSKASPSPVDKLLDLASAYKRGEFQHIKTSGTTVSIPTLVQETTRTV